MLFQFRIQIKGITKPPVWRRVLVPANFTFQKFHFVIRAAFGWMDYHLHEFSVLPFDDDLVIKEPDPFGDETDDEFIDERKIKLSKIFPEYQNFTYVYDYGDGWEHSIKLEKVLDEKSKNATLLAGKGFCPPEDCGGIYGYENLKQIMKDPKHPEYKGLKEWLRMGEDEVFNPDFFDLEETAEEVEQI